METKRVRYWKSLPAEDKRGIVRALLEAGYTREAIGAALGTTKNAVVGYQHTHLSDLTGGLRGTQDNVPQEVLRELLLKEWPTMAAKSKHPALDSVHVQASEPTNICQWPLTRAKGLKMLSICGKPCDSTLCSEHRALAMKYRRVR